MTKFSVRKPFTVFVAVVAVIVFGIISYTRMTPDLLPNMDYPYLVLVTTYPGATPGEVEEEVTKPLEQAMATLNNIKSISSTSAENYSMLMLEFEQNTSMDAAVVDILQKTQQLSGGWDDMVGTPNIIRINPSMLPVMVAAVDSRVLDRYDLCQLAQEKLIPELEGTTGLASITAGGLVKRQLYVTLSEEKLDETNRRIAEGIHSSLEEARQQLEDAQKEIDDATAKVNYGTQQLKNAPSAAASGASAFGDKLGKELSEAQTLAAQISATQAERNALQAQRDALVRNVSDSQANLNEQTALLQTIRDKRGVIAPALTQTDDSMPLSEAGVDMARLAELELTVTTVGEAKSLDTSLAAQEVIAELNVQSAQTNLAAAEAQVSALTPGLDAQISDADARLAAQLAEAKARAEAIASKEAGLGELPETLAKSLGDMTVASMQLAAAQASLATAQQALDGAYDSFETQVDNAVKAADVRKILTLSTLGAMLGAQNFDMPGGYAEENGSSLLVTVGDGIESIGGLLNTVLFDIGVDGVAPVRLNDVADITFTDNGDEIYATLNGNNGLLLMFFKQSNYATASVSDNIQRSFERLSEKYPEVSFTPLMDQGDYIYLIRDSILSSLLWGALFSVLVLFLFLRDWRPTILTLFSIPVSLLFAMAMMYFTGVSVNIMSLSGLAVSVGMLVDNSIVVIENTYRLRALGESPIKAAVSGARQVGGAVAASTLTTICVFFPIVFVSGLTRELFTDMILTLCYALIASLIISLTLVPALAGRLLTKNLTAYENSSSRFMQAYRRSVRWGVEHKAAVLLTAVALLLGSAALVLSRGFNFLPSMEMEQMTVALTMPEGATFEETVTQANEAAARMLSVDGVETVGGSIGESAGMNLTALSGGGDVTFYVLLEDGSSRKAGAVARQINELCADMPCEVRADANSLMSGLTEAMSGSGITIRIYSNDMDALKETAERISGILSGVEGVASAGTGEEALTPELHFTVNKAAAAKEGLTVAQVYMKVSEALTGTADLMQLTDRGRSYSVILRTDEQETLTRAEVEELSFTVTDKMGTEKTVALRDIADISEDQALSSIHRIGQRRYLDVTGEIAEGYNVTRVTDEAEKVLRELELPDGTEMRFSGERESIMDAMSDLMLLMLAGILLVYLVMVAQFQNLKAPFIVMFTVPLAFTGGFLALLLCGMELNILSMLGLIMLVGIIVNNGIVLVDYINQLRMGGMERRDAICEATVTRLRPILMTTITTVLGLVVMALGRSEATSLIQPLAVTCIGGLIYATLMTLYVIPVMYDILSKRELVQVAEEDLELSDK